MATLEILMEKIREVLNLMETNLQNKPKGKSSKQSPVIPQNELAGFVSEFDRLAQYFKKAQPTKKDLEEALKNPLASQIDIFVTGDKKRKAFFAPSYFEGKFNALPDDRADFIPLAGKKNTHLRAILFYLWWNGRSDGFKSLENFWQQIRNDYGSSPDVRKETEAKDYLLKLMSLSDVEEVAALLAEKCPSEQKLKEFAKQLSLKIPAQSRAKSAPKTTVYQRLAKVIHSEGGVGRMNLD